MAGAVPAAVLRPAPPNVAGTESETRYPEDHRARGFNVLVKHSRYMELLKQNRPIYKLYIFYKIRRLKTHENYYMYSTM